MPGFTPLGTPGYTAPGMHGYSAPAPSGHLGAVASSPYTPVVPSVGFSAAALSMHGGLPAPGPEASEQFRGFAPAGVLGDCAELQGKCSH